MMLENERQKFEGPRIIVLTANPAVKQVRVRVQKPVLT
jgi:hypothetical protein